MPKVLDNPYSVQTSPLHNAFESAGKDLADSLFGDSAVKAEALRQHGRYYGTQADTQTRKNSALDAASAAFRGRDTHEAAAQYLRSGENPRNVGEAILVDTANDPNVAITDPRLGKAQMGAHEAASATPWGVKTAEATKYNVAKMTTDRMLEGKQFEVNNTPEIVKGPDGQPTVVRRSEAFGRQAVPSLDQTKAMILAPAVPGRPAAAAPAPLQSGAQFLPGSEAPAPVAAAPAAAAPAAPGVSPLAGLDQDTRHLVGLKTDIAQFVDPRTRQVYQSHDGGSTVLVGTHRVPVEGSGLQKVNEGQALTQTQSNMSRESLKPLPPPPGAQSQAAQDAYKTSGLDSIGQKYVNEVSGIFNGGEVGADTNRAREKLSLLALKTRGVMADLHGRDSVQAKKWENAVLPQPGRLGMTGINADTEAHRVASLVTEMRSTYAEKLAVAQDPNTSPAELAKLVPALHTLAATIKEWETPVAEAPAAAGPQASPGAPPAPRMTPPVKRVPGQIYDTPRGKMMWKVDGWHDPVP